MGNMRALTVALGKNANGAMKASFIFRGQISAQASFISRAAGNTLNWNLRAFLGLRWSASPGGFALGRSSTSSRAGSRPRPGSMLFTIGADQRGVFRPKGDIFGPVAGDDDVEGGQGVAIAGSSRRREVLGELGRDDGDGIALIFELLTDLPAPGTGGLQAPSRLATTRAEGAGGQTRAKLPCGAKCSKSRSDLCVWADPRQPLAQLP